MSGKNEFKYHANMQILLTRSLQMKNGFPFDELGIKIRYSFVEAPPSTTFNQVYYNMIYPWTGGQVDVEVIILTEKYVLLSCDNAL